jgi:predicted nicotinamide N-methyase
MEFTREQVRAVRRVLDAAATGELPAVADIAAGVELADACGAQLDMREAPADLPTNDEIEEMARQAGLDEVPF